MDPLNPITYFAETDARNKRIKFGIKAKDRLKHMYVIGKTGMGKSTLLENLAIQDIQNGEGLAVIDPHGSMAEKLLDYVPEHRIKDVLYFAPFSMEHPIAFNVMEDVDPDKRHLVVNGLMATFEKLWADMWSARMAYILQYTILALLEYPGSTLLGINKMLSDKEYRKKVVENVTDATVKSFWIDEFGKYTEKFAAEATPAIQNKVGQFASNSLVRNIIGQSESSFDIRKIMDTKKILIINLSKGQVGEGNAKLLGSMLITKIYLAAMSRADISAEELNKLPNFYLYVDEFQSFANKSFADILSEARKYKLSLTIAHQYIEQMEEEVRDAVFGNVGTTITFRVGAFDAEVLEKEFAPVFIAEDLVNLGFTQIYLKLMIDGVSSQPFSATTMGPITKPEISFKSQVIESSEKMYGRPRKDVEDAITKFYEDSRGPQPGSNGGGQRFDTRDGSNRRSDSPSGQPRYDGGGNGGGNGRGSNYNQRPPRPSNFDTGRSDMSDRGDTRGQDQNRGTFQAPPTSSQAPVQQKAAIFEQPTQAMFRAPLNPEMEIEKPKQETQDREGEKDPNKLAFAKVAEELKNRDTRQEQEKGNMKKDGFEKDRVSNVASHNSVSLHDLKPDHERVKIPTKENVSSLKDALASVMMKKDDVKDSKPPTYVGDVKKETEKKEDKKYDFPVSDTTRPAQVNPGNAGKDKIPETVPQFQTTKEVPEDVLRKLLQVEEPKGSS